MYFLIALGLCMIFTGIAVIGCCIQLIKECIYQNKKLKELDVIIEKMEKKWQKY